MHSISHGPLTHWTHWCRDPYGQVQLNARPYATSSPPRDYLLPTPGKGNPTLSHYRRVAIKLVTRLLTNRSPDTSGSCLILIPTFCNWPAAPSTKPKHICNHVELFWERASLICDGIQKLKTTSHKHICAKIPRSKPGHHVWTSLPSGSIIFTFCYRIP